MIIRKKYRFEAGHIVRNCSSDRCKRSMHGHSYVVEVFFTSKGLDNGHMVLDFGLTKGTIKDFIDGFDHCWQYWDKDTKLAEFVKENSARWISMPVSPSAEQYSLLFMFVLDKIVQATEMNNGEKDVELYSVRVHETDTGYAEAFREDLDWVKYKLEDIKLSDQVKAEWADPEMYDKLLEYYKASTDINHRFKPGSVKKPFANKVVTQQI